MTYSWKNSEKVGKIIEKRKKKRKESRVDARIASHRIAKVYLVTRLMVNNTAEMCAELQLIIVSSRKRKKNALSNNTRTQTILIYI